MTIWSTSRVAALLALSAAISVASYAHAQMWPLEDERKLAATADYDFAHEAIEDYPDAPFAFWNSFITPIAELPDVGFSYSSAFQVSEFFPGGINMSGDTSGGWQGAPSGTYTALSQARFLFYVETCFTYALHAWVDPGDGVGEGRISLRSADTLLTYEHLESGELHVTGRLPAGDYWLEGRSFVGSGAPGLTGAAYSVIWTITVCDTSLLARGPDDLTVACGGTATFSVTSTAPPGTVAYQWRRNGVPLTDDGRITGTTSGTLVINNACHADAGYYDVVVGTGTITEPSRLAHLSITTVTGVEVEPAEPGAAFSLVAAGPNPSAGGTSFRYFAAKPLRATMAIYNVAGAKVRSLTDGVVSGWGTVTWDGNTRSGSRAPAGIYFLRVDAGSIRESRKVVLLK